MRSLDPARKVAVFADDSEMPYDLFLGVPVHRVPEVVAASGMTVDGWIPVDPLTLETSFPGVYAVGDVTQRRHARRPACSPRARPAWSPTRSSPARRAATPSEYDGRGICYLEFGDDQVAKVDVTFVAGQPPVGHYDGPSDALAAAKARVRLQPHPALVRPHLALTNLRVKCRRNRGRSPAGCVFTATRV